MISTYDFLLWSVGDLAITGPDPFSDDSNPNNASVGNTTITIGAAPSNVSIDDDDANFGDGDNSQLVGGQQTDTEYSYVVRPVGSTDPADNITMYVVYEGSTLLGVTADGPLVNGVSYDIVAVDSSGPSVAYSSLHVCYAPGTMIDTPEGPRAVEDLRPGDLVSTLDNGPQPIRWVRSNPQPLEAAGTEAKPVLIRTGALGSGRPLRDLVVSPQHRILVGGNQLRGRFRTEAFAPAKALTRLRGIRHMKGKARITWVHFACDRHEIVTANGCLSESLLLGPMVINGLSPAERSELTGIFGPPPAPDAALNGPPARQCLSVGRVRSHLHASLKTQTQAGAGPAEKWDADLAMEHYEAERLRDARARRRTATTAHHAA